ncbi:MAG: Fic family protein [Candidatus Cloacimonetes bacterium]|nr:Fic family protein [Candidatus Cloacimonadota bacterium]
MSWNPITDLPVDWRSLESTELHGLISVWKEQKEHLQKLDAVKVFNEQLRREWAIETGVIENLYTLDRGVTQLLIEHGFQENLIPSNSTGQSSELIIELLQDHEGVFESLFDFIGGQRELTTSYIKQTHALFTRHQPSTIAEDQNGNRVEIELIRGDYKKRPNNPKRKNGTMHMYCPPEQVSSEMDELIRLHCQHVKNQVQPEVQAAWLHHRFTQIHPFQDGNGRVARALATLVLLKGDGFPLSIHRTIRNQYIEACEAADAGNLAPLVSVIVSIQKQSFVKVLSIADNLISRHNKTQDMLEAIKKRISARKHDVEISHRNVFNTTDKLKTITTQRLTDISESILPIVHEISANGKCFVHPSDEGNSFWFKHQVITVAKELNYFASVPDYHSWVRLHIEEERNVDLIVSFHSLGYDFVGIIASSAFIQFRDKDQEHSNPDGPYRLCNEVFQFSHSEKETDVTKRFNKWIENVILTGLDQWRKQI